MTNDQSDPFQNYPFLTQKDHELALMMAKLLGIPLNKILESINLFTHIHPCLRRCLDNLSLMEESDYVTAAMLLQYFFISKKSVEQMIDELGSAITPTT